MTVFVDDAFIRYGRMRMSHMMATDERELHRMAAMIGIARRHYQSDHYDICMEMRVRAVKYGAREVDKQQLAAMRANRRDTGKLGDPETAIFEFRTRRAIKRQANA